MVIFMRQKIIDALKPLGIDLFWGVNDTDSDEYIIFSIYHTSNTDMCDNRHLSTDYHIVLNYWFKTLTSLKNEKNSGFNEKIRILFCNKRRSIRRWILWRRIHFYNRNNR